MLCKVVTNRQRNPCREGLKGPRCSMQGVNHLKYRTLVK
jgi:hypothetical protein